MWIGNMMHDFRREQKVLKEIKKKMLFFEILRGDLEEQDVNSTRKISYLNLGK
jgi:hypothetical protein